MEGKGGLCEEAAGDQLPFPGRREEQCVRRCRGRQEQGWGGDKEVLEQKPGQGVSGAVVMALDGLPCQIAAQWTEGEPRGVLLVSSVQFSHSVVSDSLQPHGPQHSSPLCSSLTPRV